MLPNWGAVHTLKSRNAIPQAVETPLKHCDTNIMKFNKGKSKVLLPRQPNTLEMYSVAQAGWEAVWQKGTWQHCAVVANT